LGRRLFFSSSSVDTPAAALPENDILRSLSNQRQLNNFKRH
jgi:hypothetical protein